MRDVSRRKVLGLFGMASLAGGVARAAGPLTASAGAALAASPGAALAFAPPGQDLSARARKRIQEQHLPNVPLITHEGKQVRFYDDLVKDKVVSLNFFFANCTDICPVVMANLAKVQKLLGKQVGHDLFMYSLALKPEEDTVDVIRHSRHMYGAGPGWVYLTGKPADIEKLRKAIGFTYPEPSVDQDKTQHIGNVRYGNERLMLWGACPGMASPEWIAESLEWMVRPETNRVETRS